MRIGDLTLDEESEARARDHLADRVFCSGEPLKDRSEIGLGDPDSGVSDVDANGVPLTVCADGDGAFVCEFRGVAQQVVDELPELARVTEHHEVGIDLAPNRHVTVADEGCHRLG